MRIDFGICKKLKCRYWAMMDQQSAQVKESGMKDMCQKKMLENVMATFQYTGVSRTGRNELPQGCPFLLEYTVMAEDSEDAK